MEANDERPVERIGSNENSLRAGAGTAGLTTASLRAARSALNRLIVAGRGEIMVLDVGARIVDGTERRARLRQQIERRLVFQRDLANAVTALGGVPATHATSAARIAGVARGVRRLMAGPHEGDAYAACARATERTASAYSQALRLELPADVRFGVEQQDAEVEWDRSELRRLRWGASLAPLPSRSVHGQTERPNGSAPSAIDDARALEVWSEEGGSAQGRATSAKTGVDVVGAAPG